MDRERIHRRNRDLIPLGGKNISILTNAYGSSSTTFVINDMNREGAEHYFSGGGKKEAFHLGATALQETQI